MDKHALMREAIELAEENVRTGRGGPFGCIVVLDGRVIARGTNLVTETQDPTAHAEIVAIRRACQSLKSHQLTGCEVFASCEPCPMCSAALYWARPAAVYYAATSEMASGAGFDDGVILDELKVPSSHRRLRFTRLESGDSLGPFRMWAEYPDKKEY